MTATYKLLIPSDVAGYLRIEAEGVVQMNQRAAVNLVLTSSKPFAVWTACSPRREARPQIHGFYIPPAVGGAA